MVYDEVVIGTLCIGRSPGYDGLQLSPEDQSISSVAVELHVEKSEVRVTNRSSYAQLDIHHAKGVRFLFPNEAIITPSSIRLVVPSSTFQHLIEIEIEGGRSVEPPQGTVPLNQQEFALPQERLPTLAALCIARFSPNRFGSALPNAAEISQLLQGIGLVVTAKAVNNKIQRTKEDIENRLGIYLEKRDDLADWLINNGHITREVIAGLFGAI